MATDTYARMIVDHRMNGSEATFVRTRTGTKRRKRRYKYRRFSYKKDETTARDTLEDVKKSYPIQLTEYLLSKYAVWNRISGEPTFTSVAQAQLNH
jgi:hypothetical protein